MKRVPVPPSAWSGRLVWFFSRALVWLSLLGPFRLRHAALPLVATGPVVYLGNHTNVLDPVWLAWVARRPVRFMSNERLFRKPLLGPWISALGAFPKRKFNTDPRAMRTAVSVVRDGGALGIFPEGRRSWDGRPCPLVPGLGRLLKKLDVPVVVVRNSTGHLQHPLWAKIGRWIPIELEVTGPFCFPRWMDAQAIEHEVARLIAIDPASIRVPSPAAGLARALGLPSLLWACPACFMPEALMPTGLLRNDICCAACGARWQVGLDLALTSQRPGTISTTIGSAFELIRNFELARLSSRSHLTTEEPPVLYANNVSLSGSNIGLAKRQGKLLLYSDRLELSGPDNIAHWTMRLSDLLATFEQLEDLALVGRDGMVLVNLSGAPAARWTCVLRTLSHPSCTTSQVKAA